MNHKKESVRDEWTLSHYSFSNYLIYTIISKYYV